MLLTAKWTVRVTQINAIGAVSQLEVYRASILNFHGDSQGHASVKDRLAIFDLKLVSVTAAYATRVPGNGKV